MTLYEMLSFHSPFSSEKCLPKRNQHVYKKKRPQLHDKQKRSPILFQDLMAMCWNHEPRQRPIMSKAKSLADKAEFELLRTASSIENTTKRRSCISCACVCRTLPSIPLASHTAIGGTATVDSTVRQISEHKEASDREPLCNEQSDPVTSLIKEGAEKCDSSATNKEEIMHFNSNESLNKPSTQIWVIEHVITELKPESKAVIYTYPDGFTGRYKMNAVSNKINYMYYYYLELVLL